MKSGSKVERRNNTTSLHPFRMVYPEKGGRVVRSPLLSPIKRVKTATWSRSVNSEDFLIAEADHVQIQPSTRRDLPRDTPSRSKAPTSPASLQRSCDDHGCDGPSRWSTVRITNGRKRRQRMAFRLQVRDNVKRFETIFTHTFHGTPPMFLLDELADLVQELWRESRSTPPT